MATQSNSRPRKIGFEDVPHLTKDTYRHPTRSRADLTDREGICLACGCKVTRATTGNREYGHESTCEHAIERGEQVGGRS